MNKSEKRKLKQKEQEWQEIADKFASFWKDLFKQFFKQVRISMDFMMYSEKPKNKGERIVHSTVWWIWVILIFFSIRGICYTVFGR